MKINPAIKLTQAPLLKAFMNNIIAFQEDIPLSISTLSGLSVVGMCGCGQSDCATVTLKHKREWNEELKASWSFNTNKGIVILHFLEDGFFELEAIDYEYYPYKKELQRVLHKNYKEPTDKELQELEFYFNDLQKEEIQVIVIDNE